ncbi:MAG: cyclic nucleotide-binding domain-containing protein [Nitrospirae bacterium]|nr:cyclic nucleotide-binding domain-containing protein [Nitrospirota bacterium]
MGEVSVDDLEPGMTLNTDVIDSTGRLLLRSGTVISKDNIRIFRNRGVVEVDIEGIEEEKAETEEKHETDDPVQPETSIVAEPTKSSVNHSAPSVAAVEKEISKEDENKIKIMRTIDFFKPFTDQELPVILNTSTWLKCNHGDFILREGQTSEPSFFVILKGSVGIQKRVGATNMKKSIHRLKRGECFGEMAVITGQPRSADAVAEEETYVLKIDADTLNKETDSFDLRSIQFKFYKAFAEILAERLAYTDAIACKI